MTVQDILTRCQGLGVKLAPCPEGRLRVSPPPERLPEDLREELRRHKQEILALLLAEKAEELRKPAYRSLYRQTAQNPLFDDFPAVDLWLAEHHPALWQKIRDLDDELSRLEQEGASEEVYRGKLEELLSLCQAAKSLREGSRGAMLIRSEVLGGELVWVVKDEEDARAVMGEGRAVYYADEIEALKTKTPEQIRDVQKAKLIFLGSRVVQ